VLGLRWRDVDFGAKKVRVVRPYVRGNFRSPTPLDVDDLDVDGGEAGEAKRVREGHGLGHTELVGSGRDVEPDRAELTACEVDVDRHTPGQDAGHVGRHLRRGSDRKDEPVAVRVSATALR
jgi:hypothetical protein